MTITTSGPSAHRAMDDTREPLLEVRNLKTYFETDEGIVRAVDGVSYTIYRGQTLFNNRILNITNVPGFNDTFFGGLPAPGHVRH